MKKIKLIAMMLVTSLVIVAMVPLAGMLDPYLREFDTIEELMEFFPDHYFFDLSSDSILYFGARMDRRRFGCTIVDDYFGYEIRFGYPYNFKIYSNRVFSRSEPRYTYSYHSIDGITFLAHYWIVYPSGNRGLILSFTIDNIPYRITKAGFATGAGFATELEQFLIKIITPAIVGRQKGENL